VLGSASGLTGDRPIDEAAVYFRQRPDLIEPALGRPATFEWLFGPAQLMDVRGEIDANAVQADSALIPGRSLCR
jgi:hypothetical protein